jgi:hypothetical protein
MITDNAGDLTGFNEGFAVPEPQRAGCCWVADSSAFTRFDPWSNRSNQFVQTTLTLFSSHSADGIDSRHVRPGVEGLASSLFRFYVFRLRPLGKKPRAKLPARLNRGRGLEAQAQT